MVFGLHKTPYSAIRILTHLLNTNLLNSFYFVLEIILSLSCQTVTPETFLACAVCGNTIFHFASFDADYRYLIFTAVNKDYFIRKPERSRHNIFYHLVMKIVNTRKKYSTNGWQTLIVFVWLNVLNNCIIIIWKHGSNTGVCNYCYCRHSYDIMRYDSQSAIDTKPSLTPFITGNNSDN